MKCHGCEFRELPVQRASSSSLSITSSGTGSSAYWRICDTRRIGRSAFTRAEHTRTLRCDDAPVKEIDPGELERLGSALRLAESALEEALEAAENLGNFDRRFDVPRAIAGAQRLVQNANEAVDAAREKSP